MASDGNDPFSMEVSAANLPPPHTTPPPRLLRGMGEWTCKVCNNVNYAHRTFCNMRRCNAPRPEWVCALCSNLNYAHRTHCNMRKCRAPRPPLPSHFPNPLGMAWNPLAPASVQASFFPPPSSNRMNPAAVFGPHLLSAAAFAGIPVSALLRHPAAAVAADDEKADAAMAQLRQQLRMAHPGFQSLPPHTPPIQHRPVVVGSHPGLPQLQQQQQ